MMLFRISLIALLFVISGNLKAENIYVSVKRGNDDNEGSKSKPLASIAAAQQKVEVLLSAREVLGDIHVLIEAGNYFIQKPLYFSSEKESAQENMVIYRSEGKEKPVINGGRILPKFQVVSPALWKVAIPEVMKDNWHFEQLFINGRRAKRAGSDQVFYKVAGVTERVIKQGANNSYAEQAEQSIKLLSEESGWVNLLNKEDREDAVVTIYHNWDITRKRIKDLSASMLTIEGQGMRPWNGFNTKSTFTVENAKGLMDEPGEWFLDRSGTLYYIPFPGETIENTVAVAPVLKELLVIDGNPENRVKNLSFENLSFQYTAYQLPDAGYEPEQAAASTNAVVSVSHAVNVNFLGCEFKHTSNYGVWFKNGCSNSTVKNSYLYDLGAGGIKIGEPKVPENERRVTHNIVIDNNIIMSGGHIFPTGVGVIVFHSRDNTITHNDISDLGYTGISVGWVWGYTPSYAYNNLIANNHIHHLGWGVLSDMGGVYLLGIAPGTVVENNVIHHIYSYDYGGWGLYTDEGSTGVLLRNNLVYACKSSGFHQHYGKENFIVNNIFVSQVKAQLEATRLEDHLSFTFKHNIIYTDQGKMDGINWTTVKFLADSNSYFDTRTADIRFGSQPFKAWQAAGKDQHSIIADPEFKNISRSDFRVTNITLMKQIGFKPFPLQQAGVYGSKKWKKLAASNSGRELMFNEISRRYEFKN
jgi:hypothetical protein